MMRKKLIAAAIIAIAATGTHLCLNAQDVTQSSLKNKKNNCITFPQLECVSLSKNTDGAYEITLNKNAMEVEPEFQV